MVSKKGLNYGSSGFQVPVIPRAPRSIRRKYPRRKLVEDSRLCAIELLAAVAGKLLQESESSACSNAGEGKAHLGIHQDGFEKGNPKVDKAVKSERFDLGSCAESAFVPEISVQERNLLSNLEGLPQAENDPILEHTSALASSDLLKNVDCSIKLGTCEDKNEDENAASKVGGFICVGGRFYKKIENVIEMQSGNDKNHQSDLSLASTSTVKDPMSECVNTDVLINSDSSVQLPFHRDPSPGAILRKHWNNVKLGNRDDDENSFGCKKPSTMVRSFRPQSRIGYHKIKKVLASKNWKAASKLKDRDLFNTRERMKSFYRYSKNIYAREKCQRVPIKKRKLSDRDFAVAYDQKSEKEITEDNKSTSAVIFHRVSGASASVKGHQKTKGHRVKFSIKSFRVPELYIEVLETETVGSLKRTVMEAVTATLGGGIRVGVVLKGKKVRDENRTLQQAGISQSSNLDTLGFTLEPSLTHVSQSMMAKKLSPVLPCDTDQQLPRSPTTPNFDSGILNTSDLPIISSPETPSDALTDVSVPNSKALVPVPKMNAEEALAIVPVNSKPKRTELSHRRTRRPFSVAEVEVLVEAVENLGTGRWRDVKMRAFENVDHRTYVDLKDKWKTLVHTARISPQQRRGEAVPQDLLNRVLSAHEYWSQHQTKQHGKHLMEPVKMIDALGGEITGV